MQALFDINTRHREVCFIIFVHNILLYTYGMERVEQELQGARIVCWYVESLISELPLRG